MMFWFNVFMRIDTNNNNRAIKGFYGDPLLHKYQAVAQGLETLVSEKHAGEKLPSVRALMKQFNASQATVMRGLEMLVEKGAAERIPAKGMFVSGASNKFLRIEVCFFFSREVVKNPLYGEMTSRMLSNAQSHHMHLSMFVYDQMGCIEQFRRRMENSKPDGVILMCSTKMTFELVLRELGIPAVSVFPNALDDSSVSFIIDNHQAIGLAINHLKELGHTRIALLHGQGYRSSYMLDQEQRIEAFYSIMTEQKLGVHPKYVRYGGFDYEQAYPVTLDLLEESVSPTAIICNDYNAEGVYAAINKKGLTVGKDISVLGFDDIALAARLSPELSTIRIGWDKIVTMVLDQFGLMLEDPASFSGKFFKTPVELVIRKSTGICSATKVC
jgi:DNA-binding LacI/PurR family transcriptional regulator